MKVSVCVTVAAISAGLFAADTQYLLVNEYGGSKGAFDYAEHWGDAPDAADGTSATPLSQGVDYVIKSTKVAKDDRAMRTPEGSSSVVFGGNSLTIGEVGGAMGAVRHYVNGPASVTYGTDGLFLARGNYLPWRSSTVIAGKVTVLSTASDPFRIYHGNNANATVEIAATLSGSEGTALELTAVGKAGTTFRLTGDRSAFEGAILLTAPSDELAPSLVLSDGAMPGAVSVTSGGSTLGATSADTVVTVGSLALSNAPALRVTCANGANSRFCATDACTVGGGKVRVVLDGVTVPPEEKTTLAILTMPVGAAVSLDDFDFGGFTAKSTDYASRPKLAFVEDSVADTKTLTATFYPVVTMLTSDGKAKPSADAPYALTNKFQWSDTAVPHEDAHYVLPTGFALRSEYNATVDYEFPGESLTLANGYLYPMTRSFSVPYVFVKADGSKTTSYFYPNENANVELESTVEIAAGAVLNVRPYGGTARVFELSGALLGSGTLELNCLNGGTSTPMGGVRLSGDNTAFAGRVVLTTPIAPNADERKNTPTFDRNYTWLYLADGDALGGPLSSFDPKAFTIANMSQLRVTDGSLWLDEPTRGVFVDWIGRFKVDTGMTLTVSQPLAFDGTLWKEGDGTLVLANPAPTFGPDATDTTPGADATNHMLRVSGGVLRIAAVDAVNGLDVVFTDASAKLVVDPVGATGDLAAYGIRNVKTTHPFAVDGADEIVCQIGDAQAPGDEFETAILTVANADVLSAVRAHMSFVRAPALKGLHLDYGTRTNADGSVTLFVHGRRMGLMILFK